MRYKEVDFKVCFTHTGHTLFATSSFMQPQKLSLTAKGRVLKTQRLMIHKDSPSLHVRKRAGGSGFSVSAAAAKQNQTLMDTDKRDQLKSFWIFFHLCWSQKQFFYFFLNEIFRRPLQTL